MMTDFLLMDYLSKLNDNTVKERLMHAKGIGVYGTFRPYMSMKDYTKADFLKDAETVTPVFVRFSKQSGRRGSPDTERSVKGFSTKFFTKEGHYDLICSNMPMFFINEAKKMPQFIKAFAPRQDTDLTDNESIWRFLAENPEAANIITWLYSDRGTTKSYRHIEGYSVNTYQWINADGDVHFVRYRWIPTGGVKEISRNEAEFLAGFDPDIASKDLYESIEDGQYPEYELAVQLVSEGHRDYYDFDLFDCAIEWPEKEIPYVVTGKMILNKIPKDFYEEVEKSSFSPSGLVSGITFSEDRLLEVISFVCNIEARSRGAWG